ncbi:MAG: hypothetical protein KDB22_13810 [Planctomycetales bacterium]|nr:hypothetical protein [Planctomycetales bacterium]
MISDQRRGLPASLQLLYFAAVAIWLLWPLPLYFTTALPTGDSPTATVPMLNAWIVWWNSESLLRGFVDYWDAPIFHPSPGALALSEPQPATLAMAPIVYGIGPVAAYNSYAIASLLLNGWFASRLLRTMGASNLAALAGGTAVELHPLALNNLEALQLVPMWSVMWTIDLLFRFRRTADLFTGSLVGVALGVTALLSLHHTLFFGILLAMSSWTLLMKEPASFKDQEFLPARRPIWLWPGGGLLAVATCLLISLPVVLPVLSIHQQYGFARSDSLVAALSATWADWWTTNSTAWIRSGSLDLCSFPLLPGVLRTVLATFGLCWCFRFSPRCCGFLLLMLLGSLTLSFGTHLSLGEWQLWPNLTDWLPPLSRVRSPYRFAYFTQLAIVLLASFVVGRCNSWISSRVSGVGVSGRMRVVKPACVAGQILLFAVVVLEVMPPRTHLAFTPLAGQMPAWVDFVAHETPADKAIVCLPVARDVSELANQQETVWMLYATQHQIPLVNGYSGFTPRPWATLRPQLANGSLDPKMLATLRSMGVHFLVIRKDKVQDSVLEFVRGCQGCRSRFEDEWSLIVELQSSEV